LKTLSPWASRKSRRPAKLLPNGYLSVMG
jgi:hypothetical protein